MLSKKTRTSIGKMKVGDIVDYHPIPRGRGVVLAVQNDPPNFRQARAFVSWFEGHPRMPSNHWVQSSLLIVVSKENEE